MANVIDTIYTFRFLKILSTKWEDTDAYKFGIIDEDGNPLKKSSDLTTSKEKKAYTPFVRLVFKFKRLMGKFPGGKSAVARYGAAVALIKEHSNEVARMGLNIEVIKEGLKKHFIGNKYHINEDGFINGIPKSRMTGKNKTYTYDTDDDLDMEHIIKFAVKRNMDVEPDGYAVKITGPALEHRWIIDILQRKGISGVVHEEVTNSTGGVEGKEQPLSNKGEVNKRKKCKRDKEIAIKTGENDSTNEENNYLYQVIGDAVIRVDEIKRVLKKRVIHNKRQKKREYVPTKRRTRTGRRKLRGGAKAKFVRSHRKAYRKSHTGQANHKRKISMRKSKKFNKR